MSTDDDLAAALRENTRAVDALRHTIARLDARLEAQERVADPETQARNARRIMDELLGDTPLGRVLSGDQPREPVHTFVTPKVRRQG